MRLDRVATLAGLVTTLLALPSVVCAQSITSPYRHLETRHTLQVFGGPLITDTGTLDLGPKSGNLIGARYDIHLTGPLSGEVMLGIAPTDRMIYARFGGATAPVLPQEETSLFLTMAEADLHFRVTGPRTWRGVAPYLIAGGALAVDLSGSAEVERTIPADQLFEFGPAFAGVGGLGSEFFVTEHIALRLEGRDYVWRLVSPSGLTESRRREGEWRHNFAIALGGSYHF